MSPDQQQTISMEAVAATCNELGGARLLINDLTVKLSKAMDLLKQCAAEHGPKDAATADDQGAEQEGDG